MIKFFCDACGEPMTHSMWFWAGTPMVAAVGSYDPTVDRQRYDGTTVQVCVPCGQRVKAFLQRGVGPDGPRLEPLSHEPGPK